ncbi:putative amidase [Lachnellula hyalina]|uniref:amidase n=1 Tax=Lachnellula hyalina TaxID=1316788 RepID=A0A8H8R2R7_9HELO|nr:putative amidase [Lachnellula hyalina]TVY27433.1 putative amidase [Lachnellula hyalina]
MDPAKLISKARETRDSSIARVEPPLAPLPDPLPKNVTKIPSQILTAGELEITALDAPELLKAIRDKVYSSEDVTRAFLRRAALAQKLTNCITELLPERAIERAKYLDSLPHPIGPFHGLPISIKEHHGMRGCSTNGGYAALVERDPDGDLPLNDVLWEAGAVFYARTTQPQAVMHLETSTGIYGITVNPWNTDLTAGGSSGGESALVAIRGSVLGMGGDIGGSIRCPAANTGIYGFKPTPGRICSTGTVVASSGQEGVMATKGPMSTSRSGLDLFMEAYLSYEPWTKEDSIAPIPWRPITLPPKLKIAIMWSDNIVTPHPPITRALKEVAQTLQAAGHEIVDWIPEAHDECWDITHSLYYEDGAKCVEALLAKGGEELLPLTEWLIKDNENVKWRTAEEVCALKVKRNAYRQRYNKLWRSTASANSPMVDAILCPTGPGAAPPHGNAKYWSYTSQWNLLEYPGVVFPVTSVDQKVDVKDEKYVPMNEQDRFNYDLYEPGRYVDAPVGLQIVTRKWEDEKCLKVLEVVEKAMGRK